MAGVSFRPDGIFVLEPEHALVGCLVHFAGRHWYGDAAPSLDRLWAMLLTVASGRVAVSAEVVRSTAAQVVRS